MLVLRQEHEAQKDEKKLSLEARVVLSFKYKKPNRYKLLDKLIRANINPEEELTDKTIHLGEKAKKLLRGILEKLFTAGYVLLNHKYLTSATRCKSDQNVIILSELENILKIQYYRLFTNEKGGKFSRQYHVQLHPAIAQELSDTGFCDSKSYPDFFRTTYNNRNIFNKDIRSNVHAHESNFSQTSEAISTSVKPIRLNRRKPNERKKPINADRKAKVVHFKQYKEPKNLKDHYPLNQEDCRTLQRTSGRLFTLNAMNEILLNISNKRDRRFCSKAQFLVYFTYVLKYELRDAVKTSNDKFHIKANYPHLYGNTGIVTKKAQEEAPPIVLPEGICGEFYKKLLQVYDVFVYQNWFKGLTYTANEETRCLELKALDECRTQWIETNYLNTMQKIAKSLNMEVILCKK